MGFPYGSDEDAAFIIAWLELNNYQGIILLASLIDDLDKKYDGKIKINDLNKKINFQNKSILMKGPGLIDFMNSEIKNMDRIYQLMQLNHVLKNILIGFGFIRAHWITKMQFPIIYQEE